MAAPAATTGIFEMPAILTYGDVSSSVATALQGYVHEKRLDFQRVAYTALASAVGRWMAAFLNSKGFNTMTKNYVTFSMVDHVTAFAARAGIAYMMKERNIPVKGFECVVDDILGDAILQTLGILDGDIFQNWGKTAAAAPPPGAR
jgi:hypothetical protein